MRPPDSPSPLVVAAVAAEVLGDVDEEGLGSALRRLNELFAPALAEAFAATGPGSARGCLADLAQMPLCVSVLRESLAPAPVRVGVGVGARYEACPDAVALAVEALELASHDRGLTRYVGTGAPGDILLGALCRLVDPLIAARTGKQWEAIATYRELGNQRETAARLGVTRQSVGDRLAAGHRRAVEEADAAVATYLSYVRGQRLTP